MFNFVQKVFLIFLSLYLPSAYAMTTQKITSKKATELLDKVVKIAQKNNNFSQETWDNIINLLEKGAEGGKILVLAIQHKKYDLIQDLLEKYRADVNFYQEGSDSPLGAFLSNLNKHKLPTEKDEQVFENLLEYGADPNGTEERERPLSLAIYLNNANFIRCLIQRGADPNLKDLWNYTPLANAIVYRNNDAMKKLCKSGAQLDGIDENGSTAFHVAAHSKLSKENIEILITHTCFNFCKEKIDQKRDEQIYGMVLEALLVFKKQFKLSSDLQFFILSKLPPVYFYGGLSKLLSNKGYKHVRTRAQVDKNITYLTDILLHSRNINGQNVAEYLPRLDPDYVRQVKALLDGSELQDAYNRFNEGFPGILDKDPANLICRMYANCAELENRKRSRI